MFGRVMKANASQKSSCFMRCKGVIKRGSSMGVEIIQHQMDTVRVWIMFIDQQTHLVCKIKAGALLGDGDVSPIGKRFKEQEQISCPTPLVFVVIAYR